MSDDGMCRASEPLFAERPGTTYSSIVWGMAVGGPRLAEIVALTMPCADHYNYGADRNVRD